MHTFAINLLPILFGYKIATLSSVIYCIQTGIIEPRKLYGPTGGYIFGFIIASLQIGAMMNDEHIKRMLK